MSGQIRQWRSLLDAVSDGKKEQVQKLLKNGAPVNMQQVDGKTALIHAVMKPSTKMRTEIVKELIKHGADVNMKKDGLTALMYASNKANKDLSLAIIENSENLDLNIFDTEGKTPLIRFVINGVTDVVDKIVKNGADVSIKDNAGKTALMYALENGNESIASLIFDKMIENAISVNTEDSQNQTALMKAAFNKMTPIVRKLIKDGANVNMTDKEGKTALMYALENECEETDLAIIEDATDLDVNIVDNLAQTALMKAASHKMFDALNELIKRDANVNMKDEGGTTALMYATEKGSTDFIKESKHGDKIARALIQSGAQVNMKDEGGKTALMHASKKGPCFMEEADYGIKVVLELIQNGAHVNTNDNEGNTALMHFITSKEEKNALALIENSKDLDLNAVDNQGQTALIGAAAHGMFDVAIALITRGADINTEDDKGTTALMHAIAQVNDDTALAIIEHNKDLTLDTVDNQGQTALMKAASHSSTKVTVELIKHGADVNVKDKEGRTALMHAIDWGDGGTALAVIEHAKVDWNISDNQGQTALMHCIACKEEGTALVIIEHGNKLKLNIFDNQRQTALMKACNYGMTKVALVLIQAGADVKMRDEEGRTALMFCGFKDDKINGFDAGKITRALIDGGADVDIADYKGFTALMHNVSYAASVKELIEHGRASVNSRNHLGRTALFYALVESISSTRILVRNNADLLVRDTYDVSPLSYYIHHCIQNGMHNEEISSKLDVLQDNGMKKDYILNVISNAVFCKLPLITNSNNAEPAKAMASLFWQAANRSKPSSKFKRSDSRYTSFKELRKKLNDHSKQRKKADPLELLQKLLELGADPNTSDDQGNTLSQYITLLWLYDNKIATKRALKVLRSFENKGLNLYRKNSLNETPLLFMLSKAVELNGTSLNMESISRLCRFLLQRDLMKASDTSQRGESVFHLIVKLSKFGDIQESFETGILKLLQIFLCQRAMNEVTVNKADNEMNTPLHIWAKSPSKSKECNQNHRPSERILKQFLNCGAVLYARNMKGETPMHLCSTWTAVKLLVKEGATITDVDSTGRSPLLSAAQNQLFLEIPGFFYPDVSPGDEELTFWKTVVDMGFDLWTCDKNGDSIISILIKGDAFKLARGLIKITCDNSKSLSDETLMGVLNTICKDESIQTTWKSMMVDNLLKQLNSTRRSLDLNLPLRSCCMNIIGHSAATITRTETTEPDSVHYEIAKQLLLNGASGESCLDIAESCPSLKALLSTHIPNEERPFVLPWTSRSQKHRKQLAEVARGLNCNTEGQYWYHKTQIGSGGFGQVFVGIDEKDSREVAIKRRVKYSNQHRYEDIREIRNFASLPKCEHIVRYITFLQNDDCYFIVMELMEGDLDGYFASNVYDQTQTKVFCRDVALGLKYIHEQNIIHRDLKPTNILYKTDPQLSLKIADFGLSRRIDVNATDTVMVTGVGTPCWIAPEVIESTTQDYSMSSDVFSLGLIFHYILSNKKHPFSPEDCTGKSDHQINIATEDNILKNDMEGWSKSLDPESSHRIKGMLNCTNEKERPTASMLLHHPMFWSKKKKLDFLSAVGNQEEFECPRAKRTSPLSMVEQDLEKEFATIVKLGKWNDPHYTQTWPIFIEMQKPIVKHDKKGKPYNVPARKYDIGSAVELVRFIRNAIAHVSEASRTPAIRTLILEDAVFLDEFPNLVIEVFKAVTAHGWDVSREEIKHVLAND